MSLRSPPIIVGMVVLLAAASVTGYAGVETATPQTETPSDQLPPEEVIEQRALSNNTTVESVTGTVTITSDIGNETQTMRANIWEEPPNRVRYEYVSGPTEGTVMVSSGSTFWMYNETTNTVRRLSLNASFVQDLTRVSQNLSNEFTAEYQGQATISGRETYIVSIQPPNETFSGVISNQTIWLDQDTWFPVQTKVTTTVDNRTSTTTVTYSNLTYNASIPDDRFTFEPPENATVVDTELPETTTFGSVEEAENAVNFSIQEFQSPPDGYQLQNVTVTRAENTTSVSLQYGNGTETLVFTQSTSEQSTMRGDEVSVAGHPGAYQEFGEQGILQWRDDRYSYSVTGSTSQSTLLEIAESVYC